uniref:Uncharacterized protein n=1 Tax=Timema bartmani TaxID=61472 RepID=A0A7R9HZ73_9NEOP|nr:unnamed protein product [Timema bartmani]
MFRRKVAVKEQQMFGFKEEEVKPECYHPFTEEAQVLLKKRQYNTALKYLDISLDFTPDNPLTLATKSGCKYVRVHQVAYNQVETLQQAFTTPSLTLLKQYPSVEFDVGSPFGNVARGRELLPA